MCFIVQVALQLVIELKSKLWNMPHVYIFELLSNRIVCVDVVFFGLWPLGSTRKILLGVMLQGLFW